MVAEPLAQRVYFTHDEKKAGLEQKLNSTQRIGASRHPGHGSAGASDQNGKSAFENRGPWNFAEANREPRPTKFFRPFAHSLFFGGYSNCCVLSGRKIGKSKIKI
jgi:hypothetical protein